MLLRWAIDFGFDQINEDATTTHDRLTLNVKVAQAGYIYIYLSNENGTPKDVYFDYDNYESLCHRIAGVVLHETGHPKFYPDLPKHVPKTIMDDFLTEQEWGIQR